MKLKRFKVLCTLLVLFMFVLPTACGTGKTKDESSATNGENSTAVVDEGIAKTGLPISKTLITLKGLSSRQVYQAEWNDMHVFIEFEKMSNVKIDWESIPEDTFKEKRNLKLASNDLPDVISQSKFTDNEVATYTNQGLFIPLNKLIDDYAPNLNELFKTHPTWKTGLIQADGNIYALAKYSMDYHGYMQKLFYRTDWLQKVGMKVPETTDEFYNVLKAFKEKNPSGKSGSVPFSDWSNNFNRFINHFAGSWGLGTRGGDFFLTEGIDQGPDGNMRFAKIDPKYMEVLQYFNKLWAEKLIDQTLFTHKPEEWTALGKAGLEGVVQGGYCDNIDYKEITIGPTLKGPNGDQMESGVRTNTMYNNTLITKACENPEAAMRWFDFWYSTEGSLMQEYGIKDVTYKINDKGFKELLPAFDPVKSPVEKSRGLFSPNFGDGIPLVASDWMDPKESDQEDLKQKNLMQQKDMDAKIMEEYGKIPFTNGVEPLVFTAKELEIITAFKTEQLQYVQEWETKFITGKAKFTEWDTYVNGLKGPKLDEYLKVWNDANNRTKK